jgi:cell division protein FtsQ
MMLGLTLTRRGRVLLRFVSGLLVLAALGAGGWMWLRDSSLVRVGDVTVTGVTASDGAQVRAALEEAARGMTTLHVREGALRDAVARYSSVARLTTKADFPHGLAIDVVEQRPVAALAADDGDRIPVTGSGVVLRGVVADRDLPSVHLSSPALGAKLTDRRLLGALAVAGAAPAPLLHRTGELTSEARGVVVTLRDGPELLFGDAADAKAKWIAAARVLAEPSAAGAAYLDLRIPGRVAAGGLAPVTPEPAETNPLLEGQNGPTVNP